MMTQDEVYKLVERLKSGCIYHRFDEPGVLAEYVRALIKYNYKLMNNAIDIVLEEDSRNVPPISTLIKAYKQLAEENKSGRIETKNGQYCEVCDDKGFVLMKEKIKNDNTELEYQYILYCPFCDMGQSWAYDGRKCSKPERRSDYIIPPLTKYFDEHAIEEIRQKNREKKTIQDEREGIRLENVIGKIGRDIKNCHI